ncbi:hypothetical protein Tco_1381350 [Tanacetum coccineum]
MTFLIHVITGNESTATIIANEWKDANDKVMFSMYGLMHLSDTSQLINATLSNVTISLLAVNFFNGGVGLL